MIEMIQAVPCQLCDGNGGFFKAYGDEEFHIPCHSCLGTGQDDFELWAIMNNKLVPPADGCGTTYTEVGR